MSALAFILESCTAEVEAGGLLWRVRRVTNEEADRRRSTLVLMTAPKSPAERAEEEDARAIEDPAERLRTFQSLHMARVLRWHEDPARQAAARANQFALLSEGVTDVSADGGATWEPIRLVASRDEEDLQASPPRVHGGTGGRFNSTTTAALFAAIWSLCTDGGAATERLDRFRNRGD